jgi:hypothetical protein
MQLNSQQTTGISKEAVISSQKNKANLSVNPLIVTLIFTFGLVGCGLVIILAALTDGCLIY